MNDTVRYRALEFGIQDVQVRCHDNGAVYVRSSAELSPYPLRLTDRLRHWAQEAPERIFMARRDNRDEWRALTYAQMLDGARRIGQALLNRPLSAERPVIILSDNDLEHAMLALACQYVGIPYAPVSPAYSLVSQDFAKLRHAIDTLTPGLVFASSGERFAQAVGATLSPDVEWVVTDRSETGRKTTLFSELLKTAPTPAVEDAYEATGPDTIAKFLFTSGSTGLPKAVVNTQRMLCSSMQMLLQAWPFLADEPPVFLDWLPWNHTFGGNHNVGIALYNGGTLYIDDGKPTPQLMHRTLRNLREIAPTLYFNVPKGWEELANALEQDEALRKNYFNRLKLQFYAGASLSQPVWDKLDALAEATVGERVPMTTGLGMTETAPCALFVMQNQVRAGEIGLPSAGLEIKLAPTQGKLELRYRGPNIMPGYWRSPEKTREVFDDEGYFCSGDAVKWLNPGNPKAGFVFDGRVAEDFKLDNGTWVSVGPLRLHIAAQGLPYLQDAILTGHDRSELGVLLLPNIDQCRELARAPKTATPQAILAATPVRQFFQALIDDLYQHGTGAANRITRGLLLDVPPSLDKGEITDKGAINQRAVLQHRADEVQELYDDNSTKIIKPSNKKIRNKTDVQ